MPKVSILIPTHNRARLLRKAIVSVLEQSFQDFEIIVVDDASDDDTRDVVESLADGRIRYFRHAENRGEGASRNTGLVHSTGQYIAFIDDDDTWLPDKLTAQVRLLDACPSDVGGIYTGYFRVDMENGETLATIQPEKRSNLYADLRSYNWVGTPSTVLLRRECFDRAGKFDEHLKFGPDYDMWIRISKFYQFEFISRPLVRYAVHPNRLSADTSTILRGKEAHLAKYPDYFAGDRRAYGRYFLTLGVLYCYNRKLSKGRAALRHAIRIYPYEIRSYFNLFLSLWGSENFIRLKLLKERLQHSLSGAVRH
jgi:glycosyltransferase involved in cell wall biosynthesis